MKIKAQGFVSKAEIFGISKRIKGKVRRRMGKLTNKKTWQVKGILGEVEGRARERIGRTVRKAKARF